eukprot:1174896-Amphidinium_carterae.1
MRNMRRHSEHPWHRAMTGIWRLRFGSCLSNYGVTWCLSCSLQQDSVQNLATGVVAKNFLKVTKPEIDCARITQSTHCSAK